MGNDPPTKFAHEQGVHAGMALIRKNYGLCSKCSPYRFYLNLNRAYLAMMIELIVPKVEKSMTVTRLVKGWFLPSN